MKASRFAITFVSVFALCGCSFLGEQRPLGNAYAPPPGWKPFDIPLKVAINPILGVWTRENPKGQAFDEFITVIRFPANSKVNINQELSTSTGVRDSEILSRKSLKLCSGIAGTEVQLKATATSGDKKRPLLVDAVIGQSKGETLMVAYTRNESLPSDPAAVSSIEKLCPSSEASPAAQ
jgi:hypothetical protein